eukprot:5468511-Pyramimonas_sp.AAC.1
MLRFKGLAVTCAARVRQAHALLRDAHGVWRQFSAPMPGGRRIPIYVGVDRNRFEIARERNTKKLRDKLQDFIGKR